MVSDRDFVNHPIVERGAKIVQLVMVDALRFEWKSHELMPFV